MPSEMGVFRSCRENSLSEDYHLWPFHLRLTNRTGLFVPFVAYRMGKAFFHEMGEGITVLQHFTLPASKLGLGISCFYFRDKKDYTLGRIYSWWSHSDKKVTWAKQLEMVSDLDILEGDSSDNSGDEMQPTRILRGRSIQQTTWASFFQKCGNLRRRLRTR